MRSEAPAVFSQGYSGVARGKDYERWREEICRGLCNIDIDPVYGERIEVYTQFASLSGVTVATATGSSASIGRTLQTTRDGSDDFTFVCHAKTAMPFRYRGQVLQIDQSAVLLGDLVQPSAAILKEPQAFTALVIDRKALERVSPAAEKFLYRPFLVPAHLSNIIGGYAELALKAAPYLDTYGRALMGQHLVDLTSLAFGARRLDDVGSGKQNGLAQARLALMKVEIVSHLHRRNLNLGDMARQFGLGQRQAQRLFEQSGTTFTDFVIERRLIMARNMLSDSQNNHRKIIDIAQSCGFQDLAYFTRLFRRRFEMTPSDARFKE